ncbi:hypothetical protein AT705_09250 [Pseudoalteromonas rubra]|uniref:Uncharacterized protein n=2 Tax=Pseudoalteromonas rubra TaxID=43658 RepID=A0A0U3HZM2_9GAMM|nr:hypothetical protein AT705_09250 [Pseudoalteromonas rubra]
MYWEVYEMQYLKVVAGLLGVWLVISIALTLYYGELVRSMPGVLGIDSAAMSTVAVSKAELDQVFDQIREHMLQSNAWGNRYSTADKLLAWVTILCSAIIAFLAGLSGQAQSLSDNQNPNASDSQALNVSDDQSPHVSDAPLGVGTGNRPQRYVKLIGWVAAINAVCVVLNSPIQEQKTASYQKADRLLTLLISTRKAILESNDPIEQSNLLDKLRLEAQR